MKKRMTIFLIILIIVASVVALVYIVKKNTGGDVTQVKRSVAASQIYTEKEIDDAMDVVIKHFDSQFEGCVLKDLYFEESNIASPNEGWARQYSADEAIVLYSNFEVGASGGDGSLNPNETYTDWGWILVRNKGSQWILKTWGY